MSLDLDSLAELETFDPRAFVSDSKTPQEVCDFVLALAVFYNDYRDLVTAHRIVAQILPGDRATPTKRLGETAGIQSHLFRITAAMLHELVKLFERNARAVRSPALDAIRKRLSQPARQAWDSVISATQKTPQADPLTKLLVFARHKVAFHYDSGEIARGYARTFIENNGRTPFISRGDTMAATRFYFADAAVETYMRTAGDRAVAEELYSGATPLLGHLNHAVREMVVAFINTRGHAFRSHRDGV